MFEVDLTFTRFLSEVNKFYVKSQAEIGFILSITAILWIFNLANLYVLGRRLNLLGNVPRTVRGVAGIFFSHLLHGSFNHLFWNSIPLIALGLFIATFGQQVFWTTTIGIGFLQGLFVWSCGRDYNHIGASGIISGYFGFIIALAVQELTIFTLIIAGIAVCYFGSIFTGIFPTSEGEVSWESHMGGFFAGIVVCFIFLTQPQIAQQLMMYIKV